MINIYIPTHSFYDLLAAVDQEDHNTYVRRSNWVSWVYLGLHGR